MSKRLWFWNTVCWCKDSETRHCLWKCGSTWCEYHGIHNGILTELIARMNGLINKETEETNSTQ